jgi:hypothetical protein
VLAGSAPERERALHTVRDWFDCSSTECYATIAKIAIIDDPAQRMTELIRVRRCSAESFYADLRTSIQQQHPVRPTELMPPDVTSILRHLRWRLDTGSVVDCGTAIGRAGEQLIDELGVEAATVRLAALPIHLPACIVDTLGKLSADNRTEIIKRLLNSLSKSPLGIAHCARILLEFRKDRPSYPRLARRLALRNLTSTAYVETWISVVQRCSEDLMFVEAFRKLGAVERFVVLWYHSDRLFRLLRNIGVPADWIGEHIGTVGARLPAEVVFADSEYTSDVAYPRRVDASVFGLASAVYAIGELSNPKDPFREMISEFIGNNHAILARLVRDRTRAPNVLGSLLCFAPSWLVFLPDSIREGFSPTGARLMLEQAIEQIRKGNSDVEIWAYISAVLGDLEPFPELVPQFREAVLATDFLQFYERTPNDGLVPITVAAMQTPHLGPDVAIYVRSQLVRLAGHLGRSESTAAIRKAEQQLVLSAAFNVAAALQPSMERFAELASLVDELLGVWSSLKHESTSLVRHLADGLPNAAGRHFWPIQIKLRAMD